ncbi:hypothetical protein ACHAW6_014369 [Cyclotella cf. meneghiniana]
MAPRSFEQRVYITMARTRHSIAFLSRGVCAGLASRLDCLSRFCALYSFTGALFTFFVGTMISKQPLYIQGINATNQEITKESAFGAMGMFIFLFSSSMIYLCYHKCYDEEEIIRSQGYVRPGQRALRITDYEVQVEIPSAASSPSVSPRSSPRHSRSNEDMVDLLS